MTLRFIPPKEPLSDELEDKYEGDLTVTFANAVADEQLFKLHAYILKPMILVAPAGDIVPVLCTSNVGNQ